MLQYYVCANCQLSRCPVPDPGSNTSHQPPLELLFRILRGVGSSLVKWSFLVSSWFACHLGLLASKSLASPQQLFLGFVCLGRIFLDLKRLGLVFVNRDSVSSLVALRALPGN